MTPIHSQRTDEETQLIRLVGVTKAYGSSDGNVIKALDSVTLCIDEGEFAVVLGPSGSGKTTLLNIIGALDVPTDGKVFVAGKELGGASKADLAAVRRSAISFVFQSFNLFPGLTARENVQFGIDAAGRRNGQGAVDVLASVGLEERPDRFPHQLSGG